MSLIRRRYYFWLIRAYLKRWNKTILTSFLIGAGVFFAFAFIFNFYILPSLEKKIQKIGYWGTYRVDDIPREVLDDISYGLTKLNPDGSVSPAAAYKWEVKEGGKRYDFYIKKGQYFHNKRELTAQNLNIKYEDVEKRVLDDYTVSLILKEPYAPFISTVASPIFDDGLAGLGEFKVKNVELNAGFIKSITLQRTSSSKEKKIIKFYPTENALKAAYTLGEIDNAIGPSNLTIKNTEFSSWNNTDIKKGTDFNRLVVLFYNNSDDTLSNKQVRQALNYAIPENFDEGERAYSPIPPSSIYFTKPPNYGLSDLEIAKNLIEDADGALSQTYEVSTTEEHKKVAEKVASEWKKIGVKTQIKIVEGIPDNFQMLVYRVNLPSDPDQYPLWHSNQENNIANYTSLRIDKLLEDGRSTTNPDARQSIYSDFQKYLIDDVPASFLYFPYKYVVSRK